MGLYDYKLYQIIANLYALIGLILLLNLFVFIPVEPILSFIDLIRQCHKHLTYLLVAAYHHRIIN